MYKPHDKCRACGSAQLTEVFDLGIQPLANDFCEKGETSSGCAPLKVLFCQACSLAQLSVVVEPAILYRHYAYVTSDTALMQRHFINLASDLQTENGVGSVLEIGSNDGRLLAYLKNRGFGPLVGIDPAANLSGIAAERGVKTLTGVFSRQLAEEAKSILGNVDNIIARHVFCHVDDWKDFLTACESIASDRTLIALEVPYVLDLLNKSEFDTIYHEHTSYLSIEALVAALNGTGLVLEHVVRYPIHGGAVMLLIRKGKRLFVPPKDEVPITLEVWREFESNANRKIDNLQKLVASLAENGKTVAGYGASAKSTVWINACKFTENEIRFITDNTPQKIGKLSPGTKIPIVDEKELLTLKPDYLVMFCWNFRDEVIAKNQEYLKAGGKFIVPSPGLEVVGN